MRDLRAGLGGRVRRAGWSALLLPASLTALVASVVDLRFAVPAAVGALLAGRVVRRVWPAVSAFAALAAIGVVLLAAVPSLSSAASLLAAVWVFAGMVPWLVGLAWRQSAALVRAGWDHAEQLEREQQLIADRARLRERTRIAQDMHDTLGHELSLIALRAGALKLAPGLAEDHRAAAGQVRASAAAAVERLAEVVGVLRDDTDPSREPPPGTRVAELVRCAAAAGIEARLSESGSAPTSTPAMHDHAVHRVVQEALTNVAKHAPDSTVDVHVRYGGGETELRIVNAPATAGAATAAAGGLGLLGLRERVRLAGGTFEAGPRADGWVVLARLPHAAGVAVAEVPGPTAVDRRRGRRGLRRVGAALVVLPTCTLVASGVGIGLWRSHLAGPAVLDVEAYASLRVGQQRAQVAALLPRRQLPDPPPVPAPPGATCEYYAMTGNQFDDRSGDAYRLCFRDGVLVSLGTLRS